jgi:hypothetical protein
MSGRKYPLDPLAKLRHRQVEAATQELAKTVKGRQEAERRREAAEGAAERAAAGARELRDEERAALEDGGLRAADLQRGQAWELGVEEERRRLEQQVAVAAQAERKAATAEAGARDALAAREADAEVVEKDKERFVTRERRRELAKEEENAAEVHGAKRGEGWRRGR